MIKFISKETLLHYNNEFGRIIIRIIKDLQNIKILADYTVDIPERDKSDNDIIRDFENGQSVYYFANFKIKIQYPSIYYDGSIELLQRFDLILRDIVTADDEALYVVSFDNLTSQYNYSTEELEICFRIYAPIGFKKIID